LIQIALLPLLNGFRAGYLKNPESRTGTLWSRKVKVIPRMPAIPALFFWRVRAPSSRYVRIQRGGSRGLSPSRRHPDLGQGTTKSSGL